MKVIFNQIISVLSIALIGLILVIIVWYGLWFTSDGQYTHFHSLENYYVEFSRALQKGQVALLQEPDPRLASLKDTHDIGKTNIPFLWDVSYFHGKYYIYWGPSPVISFLLFSALTGKTPPAQLGVLSAYILLACVLLVTMIFVRGRFFPRAPLFSIGVFLLVAGINAPYAFLLSRPLTYETAILSGQLFLFTGVLFWVLYMMGTRNRFLFLAGIFWGLAVLARYDLVISVGVCMAAALLYLWLNRPAGQTNDWDTIAGSFLYLLAPLVVCGVILEIYNVIRFGSPFQTGLQYQLTSPVVYYYSVHYVVSNLYVYLFYRNPVTNHFPFISAMGYNQRILPAWAGAATGKQFDWGFFGLFLSTPIYWFQGLAAFAMLASLATRLRIFRSAPARFPVPIPVTGEQRTANPNPTRWLDSLRANPRLPVLFLFTTLALSGLLQLLFLLFYYYSAVRFLSDFYLPLLFAGFFVVWEVDRHLHNKPWLRRIFWLGLTFVSLQTALIGFLSGFTLFPFYFPRHNQQAMVIMQALSARHQDLIYAFLKPAGLPGQIFQKLFY